MKDRLYRHHFPENDDIITVKMWDTSVSADFYKWSMLAIINHSWIYLANGGDYIENSVCSWKPVLSNVFVFPVSVCSFCNNKQEALLSEHPLIEPYMDGMQPVVFCWNMFSLINWKVFWY